MNSVFSAFKSSKSDGSLPSNQAKSLGATDTSSYASLRHIREIGATATMSSFVELGTDDDSIAPNLRLGNKMPSMDAGRSIELPASASCTKAAANAPTASEYDAPPDESAAARPRPDIDRFGQTGGDRSTEPNALADATGGQCSPINAHIPVGLDHSTANNGSDKPKHTNHLSNGYCSAIENKENADKPVPSTNSSEPIGHPCAQLATSADHLTNGHCEAAAVAAVAHEMNGKHTPVLSAASNRKSMKSVDPSTSTTSPNKAATNRLSKRLSLSGIGNSPLPSVHGRCTYGSHSVGASSGTNGETMRTRKTTHQRNLSLDFRWILPFLFPYLYTLFT